MRRHLEQMQFHSLLIKHCRNSLKLAHSRVTADSSGGVVQQGYASHSLFRNLALDTTAVVNVQQIFMLRSFFFNAEVATWKSYSELGSEPAMHAVVSDSTQPQRSVLLIQESAGTALQPCEPSIWISSMAQNKEAIRMAERYKSIHNSSYRDVEWADSARTAVVNALRRGSFSF